MTVNPYNPQYLDPMPTPGQPELICRNCRARWDKEDDDRFQEELLAPSFGSPSSSKSVMGMRYRRVMECVKEGTHQLSVVREPLSSVSEPSIPLL